MAFRIKRGESVDEAIRRIVREELEAAEHEALEARTSLDERVHAIRSRVKKARAALRLARPGAGRGLAGAERTLRDLGRSLARARDAAVARQMLRALSPAGLDGARKDDNGGDGGATVALDQEERDLHAALAKLRVAKARPQRWKLERGGHSARRALVRSYRRARRLLRDLGPDDTAARFHAWRKEIKRLAHQARVLAPAAPALLGPWEAPLGHLSELLGELHDLSVLRAKLGSPRALALEEVDVPPLRARLDGRAAKLRSEARALGRRTLTRRPRDVRARLHHGWRRWRR